MKELILTQNDLDDIMSAADSGIAYWCSEWEIGEKEMLGEYTSEQIGRGGTIKLYVANEDDSNDGYWTILTAGKLIKGIEICYENDYADCRNAITESDSYSKIDTAYVDSELADCIVQCAVFGDLVFG